MLIYPQNYEILSKNTEKQDIFKFKLKTVFLTAHYFIFLVIFFQLK